MIVLFKDNRFFKTFGQILFAVVIEGNVSDSPPTEELFSECEWRDWTSLSYPGKFLRYFYVFFLQINRRNDYSSNLITQVNLKIF